MPLSPERLLELQARRAVAGAQGGLRRPSPKVRAPRWPNASALRYSIALRGVVAELARVVREHLTPLLPAIVDEQRALERRDAPPDDVEHAIELARADFDAKYPDQRIEGMARTIAVDVQSFSARELGATLKLQTGFNPLPVAENLQPQLDAFAKQNVKLIRSLGAEALAKIESAALRGVREGRRVENISADLQRELGLARSRANLIAVDQVGKLNGELTRVRHQRLGIEEYDWSTSRDERVRPYHRALEGTRHRWDDPPVTNARGEHNHPGADVRCRCSAIPVVDKLLEQLGVEQPKPPKPPRKPKSRGAPAKLGAAWQGLEADGGKSTRTAARGYIARTLRLPQKSALPQDDVVNVRPIGPGVRAAWDPDTGEVMVAPDVGAHMNEAAELLAKGQASKLSDPQVKAINTVLHETIHGYGPGVAYRRGGKVVEEVATEVLARKATRKLLRIKGRPQGSHVLGLPEQLHERKGIAWRAVESRIRSYDSWISNVCATLQDVTGWTERKVLRVLEDACAAYKRNTIDIRTPHAAVRAFADGVPGLTVGQRARLADDLEALGYELT